MRGHTIAPYSRFSSKRDCTQSTCIATISFSTNKRKPSEPHLYPHKLHTFEGPANRYSLLIFLQKKMLTMLFKKAKLAVVLLVLSKVRYSATSYCTQTENSIKSMMLRQYVFKTFHAPTFLGCLVACEEDVRCQSFNYIITQDICELNNRTKEARPEHFIFDVNRYYYGMVRKRGKVFLD